MQTHLVPKLMLQNLAIILRHFNYGKNSFIVLVPDQGDSISWIPKTETFEFGRDVDFRTSCIRVRTIDRYELIVEVRLSNRGPCKH